MMHAHEWYNCVFCTLYVHYSVAQTQAAMDKVQDEEYEMSKPLARFADDEDLEKMLKERPRDGDPMLMFMKKKKQTTGGTVVAKKKGLFFFCCLGCHYILFSNQEDHNTRGTCHPTDLESTPAIGGMELIDLMDLKRPGFPRLQTVKQFKRRHISGVLKTCKITCNQLFSYIRVLPGGHISHVIPPGRSSSDIEVVNCFVQQWCLLVYGVPHTTWLLENSLNILIAHLLQMNC
jgi:hypothetical protein